jgi:hypothetical protein
MGSTLFLGNLRPYRGFRIVSCIMHCLRSLFHLGQPLLNDCCRFDPISRNLCTQKRNLTFAYNYLTLLIIMRVGDSTYFHLDYQSFDIHEPL